MSEDRYAKGPQKVQRLLQCTYSETIIKLAPSFRAAFTDDQYTMARTVAKIFEAEPNEVLRHLRAGRHDA